MQSTHLQISLLYFIIRIEIYLNAVTVLRSSQIPSRNFRLVLRECLESSSVSAEEIDPTASLSVSGAAVSWSSKMKLNSMQFLLLRSCSPRVRDKFEWHALRPPEFCNLRGGCSALCAVSSENGMPEVHVEKSRNEAFLKAFREGETAVQEGDFLTAIKAYSDAIELDPTNARAFSSRACAYMRVEHVAEAVADAKRAKALRSRPGRQNSSASAAAFALAVSGSVFRFQTIADGERGLTQTPLRSTAGPAEEARTQEPADPAAESQIPAVRVRFRLKFDADYGETLWVTGNHGALGGWCLGSSVQLRTTATTYPMWSAAVQLPANLSLPLRYKYVSCYEKSGRARWEDAIPERVLPLEALRESVLRGDAELVVHDGVFNVQDSPPGEKAADAAAAAPHSTAARATASNVSAVEPGAGNESDAGGGELSSAAGAAAEARSGGGTDQQEAAAAGIEAQETGEGAGVAALALAAEAEGTVVPAGAGVTRVTFQVWPGLREWRWAS